MRFLGIFLNHLCCDHVLLLVKDVELATENREPEMPFGFTFLFIFARLKEHVLRFKKINLTQNVLCREFPPDDYPIFNMYNLVFLTNFYLFFLIFFIFSFISLNICLRRLFLSSFISSLKLKSSTGN